MSDAEARPHRSDELTLHEIEQDFDVMDSALAALDDDDLDAAEALADGLSAAGAPPHSEGTVSTLPLTDPPGLAG